MAAAAAVRSPRGFRFKQFFVAHDKSALKVCTDSSLFGAYVARRIRSSAVPPPRHVLDIGSGCGVLSLMLAQACDAVVHGVEIDAPSAEQCAANMQQSPWAARLHVFNTSVQELSTRADAALRYDLIVSNPPFYPAERYSPIPDQRKNTAMRTDALPFADLLHSVARLLEPSGSFFVLLPPREARELSDIAGAHGLHGVEELRVRDRPDSTPHRSVFHFQKRRPVDGSVQPVDFAIKTATLEYNPDFVDLLADYYVSFYNPQAKTPAPRFFDVMSAQQ